MPLCRPILLATVCLLVFTWPLTGAEPQSPTPPDDASAAAEPKAVETAPYRQIQNVVYEEVHGIGLLMDIFVPTGQKNGLAIVDAVSGAFHSDRGKLGDHVKAGIFEIACRKGFTVFAVRPGSVTKFGAAFFTGSSVTLHKLAGSHTLLKIVYLHFNRAVPYWRVNANDLYSMLTKPKRRFTRHTGVHLVAS